MLVNGRKRKSDAQFQFKSPADYQALKKHKVDSYDIVNYNFDIKPDPTIVVKNITSDRVWACTQEFRFKIKGVFQKLKEGAPQWEVLKLEDAKEVVLEPNWFESQIRDFLIYNGKQILVSKSEGKYVNSVLNSFFYAHMSKKQKKLLCIHPGNPGYGVPTEVDDWKFWKEAVPAAGNIPAEPAEGLAWADYASRAFIGAEYEFDYLPIHAPPFYQGTNYDDEDMPNIWPMALFKDGLDFHFTFVDHLDAVFKKRNPDDKTNYRFKYTQMQLVTNQMNLPKDLFNKIIHNKSALHYRGVTRILKLAEVPPKNRTQMVTFNKGTMPDGIFIFALPKERSSGAWKYQQNVDGQVFSEHKIVGLKINYGGRPFYITEPNISNLSSDEVKQKLFFDYMNSPPFGMNMDLSFVDWDTLLGENSPYPHIWANLMNFGDKSRVVPFMDDQSSVNKENVLAVEILFDELTGAPDGVSFYCYIYHTDFNLKLNCATQVFSNEYLVV